jgi:hypothetical protein
MPERLWCFTPDDRLLTMAESGAARVWTVTPDGWLVLTLGPPRVEEPLPAPAAEEPEKEDASD